MLRFWPGVLVLLLMAAVGTAQAAELAGTVRDETGGALPGVSVELRTTAGSPQTTATDGQGRYRFDVAPRAVSRRVCVAQFRDRSSGCRPARCRLARGRHPPSRPERRRHGHRQIHLHEPGRCGEPGAEPRRHCAVREPGRNHRAPTRRAPDDAGRRSAGNRARRRHQSAQRRGESEPVPTCAASIWITAPTSRPPWRGCRSTCRPTRTDTATRT